MPETLDAVDARILDLIQHDASLSVAEIAERVGLSSSSAVLSYCRTATSSWPSASCRAWRAAS